MDRDVMPRARRVGSKGLERLRRGFRAEVELLLLLLEVLVWDVPPSRVWPLEEPLASWGRLTFRRSSRPWSVSRWRTSLECLLLRPGPLLDRPMVMVSTVPLRRPMSEPYTHPLGYQRLTLRTLSPRSRQDGTSSRSSSSSRRRNEER